jgi:type I restriction-modification system DNA methylase subunit
MSQYHETIKEYILAAKNAHTHAGKMVAFSELLKSIFGVSSYEIVQNIEQYVKTGGLMHLKGRMDMRLGQTIIEFKIDLSKELDTGKEEIERYTTILRKNGQKVAECLITDGITFRVFIIQDKPKEVRTINFEEVTPEQAIMFLDTFLFSGRKVPTADDLNMRFGPGSPIFEEIVEHLATLFKGLKEPIKFALWSKNMQLVYGSTPPDEAFVSQSYLMMLVRLLLARRLVKEGNPPTREALDGRLFDSQGINIIEEDFFSWMLSPLFWSQVKPLVDTITDALDYYDLEDVDEDIFKEIYQDIVKRGERHRIGEYYTPEWLAELTLQEAISLLDPDGKRKHYSILDPACGSGTFLTNAISLLKKKGCSLEEIIDNVYGMDLNPIAVTIARANYLLALDRMIEKRKRAIFLPVYMTDSIKLPALRKELHYGIDILVIDVEQKIQLDLPLEIALDESRLKEVLTVFTNVLIEYKIKRVDRKQAIRAFESSYKCSKAVSSVLKRTLNILMGLMDVDKDSVWVFMMRNIYAPLRMKKKSFDLLIGNPPWVSFKFIENSAYQKFVKDTVFEFKLLERKQTDLFTQMDTSTVFYAKTAATYLSDNGVLAFVMPRSVLTGAKQHEAFKRQEKPRMSIAKIIDVEKVEPLFKVPACSILAIKGEETKYPVKSEIISGTLPEKNTRLKTALKYLEERVGEYLPPTIEEETSHYHAEVLEGANIVPRTLYFVNFVASTFGVNPERPLVESLVLPEAKEPWKNVVLRNEVENDFHLFNNDRQVCFAF